MRGGRLPGAKVHFRDDSVVARHVGVSEKFKPDWIRNETREKNKKTRQSNLQERIVDQEDARLNLIDRIAVVANQTSQRHFSDGVKLICIFRKILLASGLI
jgi:hypothetical protein